MRLSRLFALLLLLACSTQAALVIAHPPAFTSANERAGDHRGAPHDPATCGMCQAISQIRAQSCAPPPLSIPLRAEVILDIAEVVVPTATGIASVGPIPRAPPATPIA